VTKAPFNAPHPTRNNEKKEEETQRILTNANTTLKELQEKHHLASKTDIQTWLRKAHKRKNSLGRKRTTFRKTVKHSLPKTDKSGSLQTPPTFNKPERHTNAKLQKT